MSDDDFTKHLSNGDSWLRALLIAVYALIFYVAACVLGLVVLVGVVMLLFTGKRQDNVSDFGHQIARYLSQIMQYATLRTDERPFPFGDWPAQAAAAGADGPDGTPPPPPVATASEEPSAPEPPADEAADDTGPADDEPAPAPKKKATRKKAAKKATRKKAGRKKASTKKTASRSTSKKKTAAAEPPAENESTGDDSASG
ncbi:MAG: DUF4389 domain-containing protein [Pseudomonadota bacterium]